MKFKLILLFVVFLFPFILSAQELSTVTFFSEDGERFTVFMDGEQKNREPMAEVRVRDLSRPTYDARIIFANRDYPEITARITSTTPKGRRAEVTYKIVKDKKGMPFLHLLVVVPIKDNSMTSNNESAYSGTEEANSAQFIDYTKPETKTVITTTTTDESTNTQTTTTRVKLDYGQRDETHKNLTGCIPMDKADFARAKQSIASNDMEEQKLLTARDIGNSNCFTAEQVTQVLNIFSLERTKLNFAKFAYSRTVDPGNYFKVNSAFETDETKKELFDYISSTMK